MTVFTRLAINAVRESALRVGRSKIPASDRPRHVPFNEKLDHPLLQVSREVALTRYTWLLSGLQRSDPDDASLLAEHSSAALSFEKAYRDHRPLPQDMERHRGRVGGGAVGYEQSYLLKGCFT